MVQVRSLGTDTGTDPLAYRADFDKDGTVGLSDLVRIVQHFGYEKGKGQTINFPTYVEPEGLQLEGGLAFEETTLQSLPSSPSTNHNATEVEQFLPIEPFSFTTHSSYNSKEPENSTLPTDLQAPELQYYDEFFQQENQLIEVANQIEDELITQDKEEDTDDLFANWELIM